MNKLAASANTNAYASSDESTPFELFVAEEDFFPIVLRVSSLRKFFRNNEVKITGSLVRCMPFNIFKGPAAKNRIDDPKDGFEENSGRFVNTVTHNNLDNLRDLHTHKKGYICTNNFENVESSMDLMENLLTENLLTWVISNLR